ncbi:MAG: hypothetical protein RL701_2101, partial [Pseudomonadota bacterium]
MFALAAALFHSADRVIESSRTSAAWKPLLEGHRREKAAAVVRELAASLGETVPRALKTPGLGDGLAG